MGELQCGGFEVYGSCGVGELRCWGRMAVALYMNCSLWELWCVEVALWGSCSVGKLWSVVVVVWGSTIVEDL